MAGAVAVGGQLCEPRAVGGTRLRNSHTRLGLSFPEAEGQLRLEVTGNLPKSTAMGGTQGSSPQQSPPGPVLFSVPKAPPHQRHF